MQSSGRWILEIICHCSAGKQVEPWAWSMFCLRKGSANFRMCFINPATFHTQKGAFITTELSPLYRQWHAAFKSCNLPYSYSAYNSPVSLFFVRFHNDVSVKWFFLLKSSVTNISGCLYPTWEMRKGSFMAYRMSLLRSNLVELKQASIIYSSRILQGEPLMSPVLPNIKLWWIVHASSYKCSSLKGDSVFSAAQIKGTQ